MPYHRGPTLFRCSFSHGAKYSKQIRQESAPQGNGTNERVCLHQVPGPGQLFKAMSVFALRDVDLTKIESRPMRRGVAAAVGPDLIAASKGRFDYLFYVDIVGGLGDQIIQNALRHLQVLHPCCLLCLHAILVGVLQQWCLAPG